MMAKPLSPSAPVPATPEAARALAQSVGLQHVALIMDGNRRWARERRLPTAAGHAKGVDALRRLVRFASDMGLTCLTVYAFSTENWRRDADEVGALVGLFLKALAHELDSLHANGVRMRFIGDLAPFPAELQALMAESMRKTAANPGLIFQVAVNYGSRAEIVRAARRLATQVATGTLAPEAITEEVFETALDTAGVPHPDLLIRTGGEYRLSNYLLWQCAYAELFVTPVLWPDFSEVEFLQGMQAFSGRERRFGQ